ncbi:MAG TPA: hypothetical protein VLR71_19185 [Casimicrobiaceae bacterium]|nr:hypothetical protein [Casimicrobiaceae bacterium]
MQRLRTRLLLSAIAMAAATTSVSALADRDNTVRWETIIGIMQAGNVVAGVAGGGQPWSTLGGNASVNLETGKIDFEVRGLVLAGGNSIGTPDSITQVKGTLVCDTNGSAGAPVLVDTPLVTLSDEGNARFHGSVGPLPAACTSEPDMAFLVRIGAGRWIANGAVLR